MTTILRRHSRRIRPVALQRVKLFWCDRFHKKWRRRIDILPSAFGMAYKVRCMKCGSKDVEMNA